MKNKVILLLAFALAPLGAAAKTQLWNVDQSKSVVNWEATKIGGGHHGTVKVKSGNLLTDNTGLMGGEILVDMNSIEIADDMGDSMIKKLATHLRSDDFFSVEKNPTASLKITKVAPEKDGKQLITGDLTIKGIPKPVTFPAVITNNGKALKATGDMLVDRTDYGIKYRSFKFDPGLGDKIIHDKFTLKVDVTANK
ncbi:MAG: YceI family protein [Bdellovibrionota bacterium]